MTQLPRSIFLLDPIHFKRIYSQSCLDQIQRLTRNDGCVHTTATILKHPEQYAEVEIVFSGWGAPHFDETLLASLPALQAVFYGAGAVRKLVSEAFWKREILLTSAYQANAIPVAEFTLAAVVFALKKAWQLSRTLAAGSRDFDKNRIWGTYHGSSVGVISLGAIGQLVCQKLQTLDVEVLAYDPFASDALFAECGARQANTLEALFKQCSVVTLHAPWLPQTVGMVTGELLRSMPEGATFINTSRGAIVDEPALLEVLQERPDLFAVLDVIIDESTYHTCELARMPNVFLSPHIAGSMGNECQRMGALAVEECRRYLAGKPPVTPVTAKSIQNMA